VPKYVGVWHLSWIVFYCILSTAFVGWYSESKLENQLSYTSKHTYYKPRDPVTQSGPHGKSAQLQKLMKLLTWWRLVFAHTVLPWGRHHPLRRGSALGQAVSSGLLFSNKQLLTTTSTNIPECNSYCADTVTTPTGFLQQILPVRQHQHVQYAYKLTT
jgi:hypothetical protein